MLRNASATPLISIDAAVIDTETTGLDVKTARIVQVGAVRVRDGTVDENERLDILVNPGVPIPQASTQIHGISDPQVDDAPHFPEAADLLDKFAKDAVIVGHNVGFDVAVLNAEHRRVGIEWPRPRTLDTLVLTRIVNPLLPNFNLETITAWLGITIKGRHSAIGDAIATAHTFVALIPMLRERGVRTLAEAEKVSRAFSDVIESHAASGWSEPESVTGSDVIGHRELARIDSFPFSHRVRDIMRAPPVFLAASASIREAATTLADEHASSAFVRSEGDGQAVGIITERDLMRQLAAPNQGAEKTVAEIMSGPLDTILERSFVYQAIGRMRRGGYRHLGVKNDEGEIIGAVTTGDLLRQRANDALILGVTLEDAGNAGELGAAWARLPDVTRSLVEEGIRARDVTAVIAEQICSATRRAGELVCEHMLSEGRGEAPAPFCLLVLGSAGRGESLLKPDQDNALIYVASEPDTATDAWFADFGERLSKILDDIGIPFCNGGVMAKNGKWRHSLEMWKRTVDGWLARSETKDLFYTDIFFDFRPVLGDASLAGELWRYAYGRAGQSPGFLRDLAGIATGFRSPIGVFGNIKTHSGRIDLKENGLLPIVTGARVLALRNDIEERATRDRLEGVSRRGVGNEVDIRNILEAHELFLRELLMQQLEDIEAGVPPANSINIKRLSRRRRSQLKQALHQIDAMHSLVGDPVAFG